MQGHKISRGKAPLPYFYAGKFDAPGYAGGVRSEFLQTQTFIIIDIFKFLFGFVNLFLKPVFFFSLIAFKTPFLLYPHYKSRNRTQQGEKPVPRLTHNSNHRTGKNQRCDYRSNVKSAGFINVLPLWYFDGI